MIGAGSVVISDINDNVIAYGNPCRIIKKNNIEMSTNFNFWGGSLVKYAVMQHNTCNYAA